jgi:hypothetical protein
MENENGYFQRYSERRFLRNLCLIVTERMKTQIPQKIIFRSYFNAKRTNPKEFSELAQHETC